MTQVKAEWSRLDQTLANARAGFADLPLEDIENMIDRAVVATRRSVRKAPGPQRDDG